MLASDATGLACEDFGMPSRPSSSDLAGLARTERKATEAVDTALLLARDANPPVPWHEIAEALGVTERQAQIRYDQVINPRGARPSTRSPEDDPQAGMSLNIAAEKLGVTRQSLRNQVREENTGEDGRARFEYRGHRVEVLAPSGRGRTATWRVRLKPVR